MKNNIKIILSILLLACLLKMPYGYYQMVRFLAWGGLGFLAYQSYKDKQETQMLIYGSLALLFQPFFKVALGRELWNVVDVVVAIGLIFSILKNRK